jgi:hypothetical protein
VQTQIERISQLPSVTDQQRVFARGAVAQVGIAGVDGHRDRLAGAQAIVGAIPADGFA